MTYSLRNLNTNCVLASGLSHSEVTSFINRNRELRLVIEID